MVLTVTESNDVKVYNLTNNKTLNEFFQHYKNNVKKLKKDTDFTNRVDFIQDFEFPHASTKVEVSEDGQYIVAAGLYGPQIKIFETGQLALKCMRGLDSEIVDFTIMDTDYKKIAMVCADRNIELHAQYGKHYKTRVPKPPRCLYYNRFSCDLMVGCTSDEIYRLNLEEGRFMSSLKVESTGVNTFLHNKNLDILLAGCDNGVTEIFDYRNRSSVGRVILNDNENITVFRGTSNPFEFYVGSSEGLVRLYDLRSNRFIMEKRSPYMLPINSIEIHERAGMVVTSDKKSIRISSKNNLDEVFSTYEQKASINNVRTFGDSGLLVFACETPRVGALFIPALGPAPKFCQFLENLTEELEEKITQNVFEDYKFVTYEELLSLNAKHLIGTDKIKPHLHGFMVASKTFDRLKEAVSGFNYEDYRKQKIQEAISQKIKDSIYVKSKRVKINDKLAYDVEKDKAVVKSKNPIDKRFEKLFTDKDFQVEENDPNFKVRNASRSASNKRI